MSSVACGAVAAARRRTSGSVRSSHLAQPDGSAADLKSAVDAPEPAQPGRHFLGLTVRRQLAFEPRPDGEPRALVLHLAVDEKLARQMPEPQLDLHANRVALVARLPVSHCH